MCDICNAPAICRDLKLGGVCEVKAARGESTLEIAFGFENSADLQP